MKFSALAFAAILAAVGSANALEITAGDYKISLDNYDSGTLYSNTPGVKCFNNVAACDAAATTPAPGLGPTFDTGGIFTINTITNISTGQVQYVRGTASTIGGVSVGPYLTGVFGGLADKTVEVTCGLLTCTTTALAVGGGFAIYSNAADYDPTLGPSAGINALTYPGISGGSLFLLGNFAAGAAFLGDATASYLTSYNSSTIAGSGSGYLDFTGGTALSFFDTNSITNVNGFQNDAFLTTTFDDVNGAASSLGWTVKSVTQVSGAIAVPEPGSLALVGLALLAAGTTTRRRRQ